MTEEIRYNCPFCINTGKSADVKGHLYVNPTKNVYHCFRCGVGGRVSELQGIPLEPFKYANTSSASSLVVDPRRFLEYSLAEVRIHFPKIYNFLERKKAIPFFPLVTIIPFHASDYGLVLPIQFDGRVAYQVRTFAPNLPKYLFSDGFSKADFPLGLDELKHSGTAMLVEGYFDYLPLKGFAVCTFGKGIHKKLPQILRLYNVFRIIVLWDADSHLDALKDAVKLYKLGFDAYAGFLEKASPGDFTLEELQNTTCIRVKDKTLCHLKEFL